MADDMLQETVALELKRKPWLQAEGGSIWEVTGKGITYPGTFDTTSKPFEVTYIRSLAVVEDHGDGPVFVPMSQGSGLPMVTPTEITHAVELILVHADHPREAYYLRDQTRLDPLL